MDYPCHGQCRQSPWAAVWILLTCLAVTPSIPAADKSGVSPNTISLPKGPGSIEGLGESFQPTLNTGTAKYGIALKLPPGTAGHAPDLRLAYEGGGGNGPLGFGWHLPLACVQRRSDGGIPTYGANVGFAREDVFINEMKEELVPTTNSYYFSKNEGAFIRYRQVSNHWEGTLPDGTRLEFGLTSSARIEDAATARVFAWLLERETDTRGNTIVYSYTNFPGQPNTNQKYLAAVRYGPGAPPWSNFHFAAFRYEDRRDWFEDCRAGFAVRTGKRLHSVIVGTQGPALSGHLAGDFDGGGVTDYLNRRYDLAYVNYAGTNSHWSLLGKLTMVGADGVTALPPALFGYTICHPPPQLSAANREIGGVNEPPFVMDNALVDLADLNGDGFPDILKTGGPTHQAYLNLGETNVAGSRAIRWAEPVEVGSATGDAWSFSLSSANTHLADMDGDGLADLVNKAAGDGAFYFANRGRTSWGERKPMSVESVPPPAPFGSPDVRTADVDFDKRTDLIRGDGLEYQVWFNLGGDRYSERITVPNDDGFDFSLSSVQFADWNGDRVPDLCRVWPTGIEVTAGFGYGQFAAANFVALPDYTLDAAQTDKAKLTDLNGDGLADLILERANPGELWFWLNLGNYSLSGRHVITDMPTGIGPSATIRWADLNGNGTTDLIYADRDSSPRLRTVDIGELLGCGATPNMMVTISNGIGRATLIGYQPSTVFAQRDAAAGRAWPDVMPFPVSVVAAVTNLDSLGHAYVTQFRYHDGFYDPGEKQFRGFARVEQIDIGDPTAPTLVTRSHFDTGRDFEPMKGKLLVLTAEQEDGAVFWNTTNYWTIPPVMLYTGTNGTNVTYVHPTANVKVISELGQGTPRRLESEFAYDNYGNQITNTDYGIVVSGDRTAFNDERITVTEYAINTNTWIIRTPCRQEVKDENGAVISRAQFFYDDETFSGDNPCLVTIGNLTMKREWIWPATNTAYIAAARTKYDSYGNPVTLLDPLATAPTSAYGHYRQLDYDALFHTYPTRETIHLGTGKDPLIFQAGYDAGFGTATKSIDFNGNETDYGYDALARLTSIVKPYDSTEYPTIEYDYVLAQAFGSGGVVNYIETRQLDKDKGSQANHRAHYFLSRQFVDGLGRNLLTKQEAEPAPGSTTPRVVVTEAVQFNTRQKPARVLNPHFSLLVGTLDQLLAFESIESSGWQGQFHNEGNLASLTLGNVHATRTEYDATLREVKVVNPDSTFSQKVYKPLVSESFDENDTDPKSPYHDTPMVHYQDGLGRLVRVDELARLTDEGILSGDVRTWTTRYEYDLNDQLAHITDSQNNVKTFTYDGLRRKQFMNDPDRGVMNWIYDDASNLKESTDAKGQRITYTYDGANRIRTEKYHDGRPQPLWRSTGEGLANSVVYHYDEPFPNLPQGDNTIATAQNVKGALAWVEDLSGEEYTSYDFRGRIESVVKRIPDPVLLSTLSNQISALVSYATRFQYDSLDRVTGLTYPDLDELGYEYNDRSLLRRIPGGPSGSIISNLVYQPSAQNGQIDYGNRVRTTYAYDSRLRLKNLLTVSQPSTLNQQLINFAYDFDGVSNIKSIKDRRPGSAVPEGDPRRNTQLFQYDDLYRLTHAQYSFAVPGVATRNDGEINYRYDRIGNMLAQTSTLTNHVEKSLPVADLGQMDSGGSAGRWSRAGRGANDDPGPHALTAIRHSPFATRYYPYDSNGNMTDIDGLVCTWDFKDRLVAVENIEMRAVYTYDFADRRIIKTVDYKPGSGQVLTNHQSRITTLYINKYFEVREHDAPNKYVWNGNTRVAGVTGSLNTNVRVQRLRVFPGWNLCSLAVSSPSPLWGQGRGEVLSAAYRWNPVTRGWDEVLPNDTLPAGTVLWLQAITNATMTVTGVYSDPTKRTVAAGGDFLPSPGLEAWNILSTISNQPSTTLWTYDTPFTRWLSRLPAPFELQSDLLAFIAPGQAVFARGDTTIELEVPESALSVRYYHQDHLGSTSGISDNGGILEDVSTYSSFGDYRLRENPSDVHESYRFGQKEQDAETRLYNFEARLYLALFGRFISVDPMALSPSEVLYNPQALHAYAFARNNPIVFGDPSGAYAEEVVDGQVILTPAGEINGEAGTEDWASKIALERYGYENAYRDFFKPTPEALAEQGLAPGQEDRFDWNRITEGVRTFIDIGPLGISGNSSKRPVENPGGQAASPPPQTPGQGTLKLDSCRMSGQGCPAIPPPTNRERFGDIPGLVLDLGQAFMQSEAAPLLLLKGVERLSGKPPSQRNQYTTERPGTVIVPIIQWNF